MMGFLVVECAQKRKLNNSSHLDFDHDQEEAINPENVMLKMPRLNHNKKKGESKRLFVGLHIVDYPCRVRHLQFVSSMNVTVDTHLPKTIYPFYHLESGLNNPKNVYEMILYLKKPLVHLQDGNIDSDRLKLIFFEFPCVDKICNKYFKKVKSIENLMDEPVNDFIALNWLENPQQNINYLFWHLYNDYSFILPIGQFFRVIDFDWID